MRPKFVAAMMSLSALLLAAALWLKKGPETTSPRPPSDETAGQAVWLSTNSTTVEPVTSTPATSRPTPEQERASVEAEIERLTQLSLKHDPAFLPEILGALTHPDREVREAAIDATTQVGDSNAIPALKAASEMVSDLEEKVTFLEAMEFLSVPSLTFDGDNVPKTPEQIAAAERMRGLRRAERERENRERHSPR